MEYFSDRKQTESIYSADGLPESVWQAIRATVFLRIRDGSLGYRFPTFCPDGNAIIGTDEQLFWSTVYGHIPNLPDIRLQEEQPDELCVYDLIEFVYQSIAFPEEGTYHGFYSHHHLSFDEPAGRSMFRDEINTVLRRNRLRFRLDENGRIAEEYPKPVEELLAQDIYTAGDAELAQLISESAINIRSPDPSDRQSAIEQIWDAWERIKTIKHADKKEGAKQILDIASLNKPQFGETIRTEAHELTKIGNTLRIRHSETTKELVETRAQTSYLYFRCFALIQLLSDELRSNETS